MQSKLLHDAVTFAAVRLVYSFIFGNSKVDRSAALVLCRWQARLFVVGGVLCRWNSAFQEIEGAFDARTRLTVRRPFEFL